VGVGREFDGDQHADYDHGHDHDARYGADHAHPVGAASFRWRRCRSSALHTLHRYTLYPPGVLAKTLLR